MSKAIFGKIAQARASGGNNIIKDGKYVFEVVNFLIDGKFGGTFWISEMRVVEAQAVDPKITPNAVGTMVGYVQNLDKNLSAAGNAKAQLLALYDADESETKPEEFEVAIERATNTNPKGIDPVTRQIMPVQPCRGMLLACETFHKPSRAGKDLLLYKWAHVAGQTDAQIAARRASIDRAQTAAPSAPSAPVAPPAPAAA